MKETQNERVLEMRRQQAESKERNRLARAEAKKEKAERLFALRKELERRQSELDGAIDRVRSDGTLSQDERKERLSELQKQRHGLPTYARRQRKDIRIQTAFKARNRHFLSAVDAFFSRPPMWVVNLVFVAIFVAIFVYFGIECGYFTPGKGATSNLLLFAKGLFVPDYDLFFATGDYGDFTQSVVYLCLQTFGIAFVGTLFSAILSIPFGFFASKKLFGNWSYISMVILIVIRTIPEIVFCFIMVRITGFSPMTGVIVLSIQSIGMIGKMYSDNLDSIDMTFLEALDASGATALSKIRLGVVPQVFPNFMSTILYRFDLNLRTASILGLVGAGDLGRLILTYSRNANWPQLGALIWGLLIMVLLVDFVSTTIRKKLV